MNIEIDENIIKYRTKHKRCKWCKYYHIVIPPYNICPSYYECVLKDKIINFDICAIPCRYYTLHIKDNEDLEIIKNNL